MTCAEGFFSIFKRGMIGIYQHCSERHLHRYLAEYDLRYSYRIKTGYDDVARAERAVLRRQRKEIDLRNDCGALEAPIDGIGKPNEETEGTAFAEIDGRGAI